MKLYVCDAEAGNKIEEVKTIQEGIELIKEYEAEDKEEGTYTQGFYTIEDENYNNVI